MPLFVEQPGFLLVHAGLNPDRGREGTTRQQALVLRRWPSDEREDHPFWWQRWRQRPYPSPLIVHGHDAMRGLQDHRPHTLGLDSGCVYGGALTGYLVEENRLVREPARELWSAPRGKATKDQEQGE